MDDETATVEEPGPDYAALIATGERVSAQMEALREDLRAAKEEAAKKVEAAEARAAANLKTENAARRRSQRRTWVTVLLDVALSLVSLVLWHAQADTNHRLQESLRQNYMTQAQQAETRVRVLCPLYTLLLASTADPTKRAALPAAQRVQYDASVKVIKDGYTALGCRPALPTAP